MKDTNIIGKIYLISTLKMAGFCRRPNSESSKKGSLKVKQSNFSDIFILSVISLNEQLWNAWKLIDPCPSQCLNINVLIDLTTLLSLQFHSIPRSQVCTLTLTYQFESFESYYMLLLFCFLVDFGGSSNSLLKPPKLKNQKNVVCKWSEDITVWRFLFGVVFLLGGLDGARPS